VNKRYTVGFILAFGILVVMSYLSYQTMMELREDTSQVVHSHQVMESLNSILSLIRSAESETRGFGLSGTANFLEFRQRAIDSLQAQLHQLDLLTANDKDHHLEIGSLKQLANERVLLLDEAIDRRRSSGLKGAAKMTQSGKGKAVMDRIEAIIAEMNRAERALLAENSDRASASFRNTAWVFLAGNGLGLLLLASVFTLVAREIRHRRKIQDDLRESESKYRQLVETANDIIYRTDEEGRFSYVNPVGLRITGYTEEETLGRRYIDVIYEPFRHEIERYYKVQAFKGEAVSYREVPVLKKNGQLLWLGQNVQLLIEGGKPVGFQAVARDITLQRKAENERDRVFDLSIDLLCVTSFTGYFIRVNSAWQRVLGIGEETLLKEPFLNFVHPDERARTEEQFHNVIGGKQLVGFETRFLSADGSPRWIEWSATADTAEHVIYAAGRDVTDRKRIDDEIRKSEARYRILAENATDVISRLTPEGIYLYVSPACKRVLGYEPDELIGRSAYDLFHPDDYVKAQIAQVKVHELPEIFTILYRIRTKDGAYLWFESTSKTVKNPEDGRVAEIVSVSRDITFRKSIEENLKESERRLEQIIETVQEGITLSDKKGRFEIFNTAMEHMTGYTMAEANSSGDFAKILYPGETERQRALDGLKDLLETGKSTEIETTIHTKGGDSRTLLVSTTLVTFRNHIMFLSAYRDITERKKAEEELKSAKNAAEAATRAKSDFLAMMSHEIRTPMNSVIGMTDLLSHSTLTEEQRDFVDTIRGSGESLLTIINDILDFSKIESGKIDLEERPCEPRTCIEEVLDLLTPKAIQKGLDLLYWIDPQVPPHIIGDAHRLRQILVNLVGNSIKFTDRGEVFVSVNLLWKLGDKLELQFSVRDSGVGIPTDKLDRLFKPFSQVDTSTTRKFGGTGLGLAISMRLTHLMGGRIWAESEEGKGSTFFFTIKTATPPPDAVLPKVHTRAKVPELTGKRVLIVDDNATNLFILRSHCENWGMLVRTTQSPREAIQWVRNGDPFDVGILDMMIPEMDGHLLGQELRKIRSSDSLPLVLLSSAGMSAGEIGSGDLFSASVAKPVKHNILFDILMESMGGAKRSSSRSQPKPVERLGEFVPLSILAAEDNPVNQKLLLRVLKEIGYEADVVPNGVEVMNAVKRKQYSIIFMDVHMPEMDGLEATRLIMSVVPRERRPVIIAVTADALEGDREKCMQAGMDDYITKPIRIADIQGVLQRWSSKAAGQQPPRQTPTEIPGDGELEHAMSDRIRQLGLETDPAFVVELIESYSPLFTNQSRAIEEAFSKQDEAKLRYAAHSLKGASLNIGANKLGAICRTIEDLAEKKDLAASAKLLPDLKEVMGSTLKALETIKAKLSREIQSSPHQGTKG